MSRQAIDLYRVQRQLVREIGYWKQMDSRGDKPTLLDALRILQWEQQSLFWYVVDFGKIKAAIDKLPFKTFMTKLNPEVFAQ